MPHVVDDADDPKPAARFVASRHAHLPIERVAIRPEPLGHGAIDHGDPFGSCVVSRRELASVD